MAVNRSRYPSSAPSGSTGLKARSSTGMSATAANTTHGRDGVGSAD